MNQTISTVISLLWTVSPQSPEHVLINQLNHYHKFDQNVFLLDDSVDLNRFINVSHASTIQLLEFTPQCLYFFENVYNNKRALETFTVTKSKNTLLIVSPGNTNFNGSLMLLTTIKGIQRLNIDMKIGVIFSDIVLTEDLIQFLEWFWKHQIINIFIAFDSFGSRTAPVRDHFLDIFHFNILGNLVNVSGSESFRSLFPHEETLNFQQHPLRLTTAALVSDQNLWRAISQVLNATTVSQWIRHNEVDVITKLTFIEPNSSYLYPLDMPTVVIVVPEALPYSKFSSYVQAITSDKFIAATLITIIATVALLTFFRYVKETKILLFQSAADVLNLLLVNDNGNIEYQRLSIVETFVILPLTFGGFVVVNWFLSTFQSYLTRPYIQPEINTIEDIYGSPFPILTTTEHITTTTIEILNSLWEHGNCSEKVRYIDPLQFNRELRASNTSISFPMVETNSQNLMKLLQRLRIRGFRVPSKVYLLKSLASYAVRDDFPFIDQINQIIHRIRSTGLYDKWLESDFWMPKGSGMIETTHIDIDRIPSFEFIVYGWIAASVFFVLELLWKNLKL